MGEGAQASSRWLLAQQGEEPICLGPIDRRHGQHGSGIGGPVRGLSLAIGLLCDGDLDLLLLLLLLDKAIENDAQDSGARDGSLSAAVIKPLELALGDHDGDGFYRGEHGKQAMGREQVTRVSLSLGG